MESGRWASRGPGIPLSLHRAARSFQTGIQARIARTFRYESVTVIHLILCWHFHQPDYRAESGEFFMPWTYLHALKDYADMAAHLEAHPQMRAVVNFVPTLLEQLDDYADQFRTGRLRDPMLARLIDPDLDALRGEARCRFVQDCFHLNAPTMLDPFPGYRRLRTLWQAACEDEDAPASNYLSGQYLADLVTWYHLAWTGETLRRDNPWLLQLLDKGAGFSLEDRRRLFELVGETISNLVDRYRQLAERGQIELSTTPHSHPLGPLLVDFGSAREALPGTPLPECRGYPDGAARLKVHVEAAQAVHRMHFGRGAEGGWPAEGAVSEPVLRLFGECGMRWVASGEAVLRNCLKAAGRETGEPGHWLARPWWLPGAGTAVFFRDDGLSDLIGFDYKGWFAKDAVRHFVHTLEERYRAVAADDPVVSIILDGENAWEYYPYNGWYFLNELYQALIDHPSIHPTTFSEYLELYPERRDGLPGLTAGSWVYGDFSTWIGDAAKNRAWDLLCAAKRCHDRVLAERQDIGPDRRQAIEAHLRSCESSDWFWWFGDYNPRKSVEAFDRLFRAKLRALYELLETPPPLDLDAPICHGGGEPEAGGSMRRSG